MTTTAPPSLTPGELAKLLATRRLTWMVPVLVCGVLAAGYSLVMPRYWEASQALVVRQETAGARGATPGKFSDLYEMRTLQETILELAKSQQVVASTLKAVNLRALGVASEPTAEDIERFRKRLKMLPPNGGEFGKSEVFYFCVKDKSQARALELVAELCNQLDVALKQLRTVRAKNLIVELEQQVAQATATLNNDTRRLAEFEAAVGADLGELRMLHSAASGQSDLRQEAVQLEAEHRRFRTQVRETEQLLAMLRAAQQDPQQIVATPNSLLAAQPALRRLKDGLVDAQLATAKMAGTRSADHPRVKAAAEAESQIRADLHRELVSAIRGAEAELRLSQQRVAATESRQKNLAGRLGRLAEQRAEYSNRVAAVDGSRRSLDVARQNLATAMAAQAAATGSSLVTRLDLPETGPYPVGPGRTVITGAGAMGGLMLGLGLVFLGTGAPIDGRREPQQLSSRGEKPRERVNESAPSASAPCRASAHEQYIAAATLQGPVATPVEGGPTNGRPAAELAAWGVGRSLPTARDMSPREGSPAAAVLGAKVVTSAAPPGPLRPRAETVAPVASSRPSPLPPGVLPAAGGGPSSAVPGVASGGLSLEQARQAARQIAR